MWALAFYAPRVDRLALELTFLSAHVAHLLSYTVPSPVSIPSALEACYRSATLFEWRHDNRPSSERYIIRAQQLLCVLFRSHFNNNRCMLTSGPWPSKPSHRAYLHSVFRPKRSIADLLIFPLSMSIARETSTQSALTVYHLGPTSLAPGICGSSHSAVVCRNAASLSFSTENLITLEELFPRHTRKSST